jgi:hypothetical protein
MTRVTTDEVADARCCRDAFYCRWDRAQQQYQKQLLSPELQRRLSPDLRRLLALDDLLNDELSSKHSGRGCRIHPLLKVGLAPSFRKSGHSPKTEKLRGFHDGGIVDGERAQG